MFENKRKIQELIYRNNKLKEENLMLKDKIIAINNIVESNKYGNPEVAFRKIQEILK